MTSTHQAYLSPQHSSLSKIRPCWYHDLDHSRYCKPIYLKKPIWMDTQRLRQWVIELLYFNIIGNIEDILHLWLSCSLMMTLWHLILWPKYSYRIWNDTKDFFECLCFGLSHCNFCKIWKPWVLCWEFWTLSS